MARASTKKPISTTPVITASVTRISAVAIGMPSSRLKSVKPLLPPKPVSLRKNSSIAAKVSACVMMEKYTPLMRERKANQPKTKASSPGTAITRIIWATKLSDSAQCQGSSFQFRNTMKSGSSLRYWPSLPIWRIRYMPMP
jgi:hypothetical protein